ncbi:MAG: DNA repair protein RecN [Candidatus Eremiobacteraeota bacterium]|nr:DNA repair protein RecN [Candidatus Eremiobacteraeota bacterium]
MLRRLEIEDYGLIARARIDFARGATIFTGETGSGKTMLLGALAFAMGTRAAADIVGRGAARAVVTLEIDPSDALQNRLQAGGFDLDSGEAATIVREMSDTGRSSLRLCGRPSTAAYVRELAASVAEIVGQFEAQRLLSPAYHLTLLDRFAGTDAMRARDAVARAYAHLTEVTQVLAGVQADERRARVRYDDAVFALGEIESARLVEDEDERLTQRRRYLDNLQHIAEALARAQRALTSDDAGAIAALGASTAALLPIAGINEELRAMADQAAALQSQANDLAAGVMRMLDGGELDPGELDAINARLDLLDRLKRKYGGSIASVTAFAAGERAAVDEYEGRDRRIAELTDAATRAERELTDAAATLSALRKRAAATLAKRVVMEFADLALAAGRFEVAFDTLERVGPDGAERTEFLFAANAGESPRPLARIASGGELSRVLLALVVALANARESDGALVFDEIDTGIGGATGAAVGARIGRLARDGQVVCVTHLAQLATWADRHYVLEKIERRNATTIAVREISGDEAREGELARMLSGETHDAAIKHARALLKRRTQSGR